MINETISILNEIMDIDHGSVEYLLLNGSDNKIWLFPKDEIRQGLQMYQPGSVKGKLFKFLLPYCKKFKYIMQLFGVENVRINIKEHFVDIFRSIIEEPKDPRYTFYVGDSRFPANRKVIVQITDKKAVKAFAKFTSEEIVAQAFDKEVKDLEWLAGKGISEVPKVLWVGKVGTQTGFVQNSVKQGKVLNSEKLTERHWDFLENLYKKTSCRIDFNDSDFAKEMSELRCLFEQSTWKSKQLLIQVIDFIKERYAGKQMEGAFFHGDFTPWNICCKEDSIYVFDFEYAHRCFPLWLDAFHFITQVGILSSELTGEQIYQCFLGQECEFGKHMESPKFRYLCYLIHILGFYYMRWNGTLSEEERSCKAWLQLIERCYQDLT